MKQINKTRLFTWILAIAPIILVSAVYKRLPDEVPRNWGFNGDVDYGSKTMLWWLAGMSPATAALFMLFPRIDPRGKNYSKFRGAYDGFCLVIMLFMLGLVSLVISESLNPGKIEVASVVVAACGLLFVFIGSIMPRVKSNFFMGIRTPWALSNSEVWDKTHRLAGRLYFFGGLVTIALTFFLRDTHLMVSMLVIVAAISLVPYIMSYVWYRKLQISD